MDTMTTGEARDKFSDLLNRTAFGKERVVLTRRGKGIAALVPLEDLHILEALEERIDLEDARLALAEPGPSVRWERMKEELGL